MIFRIKYLMQSKKNIKKGEVVKETKVGQH